MRITKAKCYRPLIAAEILAILRDHHRQQCQHDPAADPEARITSEMTVAEWRAAGDLVGWRKLGRALNAGFGTSFDDETWRRTLEPAKQRTLADVCTLLATTAPLEVLEPLPLFGRPCREAAVFFAVRDYLANAGAEARRLKPSTALAEYTRTYPEVFLGDLTKLAPGALPPVRIENPFYTRSALLYGVGYLMLIVAGVVRSPWIGGLAVAALILGWIGTYIAARHGPRRVTFGALRTFADLSRRVTHTMTE